MTRPSLAGIEQRTAAATEGPWFQGRNGHPHESTRDVYSKREPHEPDSHDIATYVHSEEDATLIAHARTDLPALTDAVRDVIAVLDRHERDSHLGREQWNADIRDALTARLDLTDLEGDPT